MLFIYHISINFIVCLRKLAKPSGAHCYKLAGHYKLSLGDYVIGRHY